MCGRAGRPPRWRVYDPVWSCSRRVSPAHLLHLVCVGVEDDAVVTLGLLDGDVAVPDVLDHVLDGALARVAPAAAGAGDEPGDLAPLERGAGGLAGHDLAAVLVEDVDGVARAVAAAGDAPRHVLVAAEGGRDRDPVDRGAVVADAPAPAAVAAGAGVGRVESELVDDDPVPRFRDLDRNQVGLPVADAHQPGFAVFAEAGAPAAGLRLDEEEELARVRVQPGDDDAADRE